MNKVRIPSTLPKIIAVFMVFLCFSCDTSEDSVADENTLEENTSIYPISLSYSQIAGSTLVHYKGGVLASTNLEDFDEIFDGTIGLETFNNETEIHCKSTLITFNSASKLTLAYDGASFEHDYFFQNDTLKLQIANDTPALAVGTLERLTIYGSLYYYNIVNDPISGSESFLKFNFNDQFFLNASDERYQPINGIQEMTQEDEVTFFNRSYRLEPIA